MRAQPAHLQEIDALRTYAQSTSEANTILETEIASLREQLTMAGIPISHRVFFDVWSTRLLAHPDARTTPGQPTVSFEMRLTNGETMGRAMSRIAAEIGQPVESMDFTVEKQMVFPGHWVDDVSSLFSFLFLSGSRGI